jgi:23S rRNA pseudouridine1911/1915/1917 synthase
MTQHTYRGRRNRHNDYEVTEPMELMAFLQVKMPEKSRNSIKSFLAHRQILVDNQSVTQYNHPLRSGQLVSVVSGKVPQKISHNGVRVLFEDRDLIVVEKRAGLLTMSTGKAGEQTVYNLMSEHVKKEDPKGLIFILHRLDRDTSGVLMFAKSEDAQRRLQDNWDNAILNRKYIAVVEGVVEQDNGTISSWLKENKNYQMYSSPVDNGGQHAITHYKVLKRSRYYSMLELSLETGRKNQIRVHMQDLGHSIVGDKKYGAKQNPIGRLGLHAHILAFKHPYTRQNLSFESFIPKNFLSLF